MCKNCGGEHRTIRCNLGQKLDRPLESWVGYQLRSIANWEQLILLDANDDRTAVDLRSWH
jgi:hypothetical protein